MRVLNVNITCHPQLRFVPCKTGICRAQIARSYRKIQHLCRGCYWRRRRGGGEPFALLARRDQRNHLHCWHRAHSQSWNWNRTHPQPPQVKGIFLCCSAHRHSAPPSPRWWVWSEAGTRAESHATPCSCRTPSLRRWAEPSLLNAEVCIIFNWNQDSVRD